MVESKKNEPKKLKVLCVCTKGLNRSKYLAEYLREKGYDTKYRGVGPCRIDPEPKNPVKKEDIEWADIIITARKKHKPILNNNFGVRDKRIICLDITDSRKAMGEIYPEFKNIEQNEFNKKWTYPQLRKEIEKYLPLAKKSPVKINIKIDKGVNFLMILYQIIKNQNSFENLNLEGTEGLNKEDKGIIKEILRSNNILLEAINKNEKLEKIYSENKELFEYYWKKNKNLLCEMKNKFKEKFNFYDFSIFEKVGKFFDFEGPKEIDIYICLGNETMAGTGNAFSPNLAFLFPRNFNNYSKETIDADFAVLIHEIMHLFQNMCNEKDKNLREKVAQCFAPRGILINEEKYNGNELLFEKVKFSFQEGKSYLEIREKLLSESTLLEENKINYKEVKNERI